MDQPLTQLLNEARIGDSDASARLFRFLYDELKQMAQRQLHGERVDLQATGLVHEAFLKLFGGQPPSWENRRHFFGAAAQAMRRILVDVARSNAAQKRGGDRLRVTLCESVASESSQTNCNELLDLHDAMTALEREDAELGKIVELRFFAGQSMEAIAKILGLSLSTVERRWRLARAFLVKHLSND